jgi:hypothetical protein
MSATFLTQIVVVFMQKVPKTHSNIWSWFSLFLRLPLSPPTSVSKILPNFDGKKMIFHGKGSFKRPKFASFEDFKKTIIIFV